MRIGSAPESSVRSHQQIWAILFSPAFVSFPAAREILTPLSFSEVELFYAGKGRDLRGEHGGAAGAEGRGDEKTARALTRRRRRGPGKADRGQPAAGFVGGAALRRPRREHGRSLPGGRDRPDQGHRRLRPEPERAVLHLWRSSDYGMAKSQGKRRQDRRLPERSLFP